jgi:glycosyltransferase involved in cell wall biosynthesis
MKTSRLVIDPRRIWRKATSSLSNHGTEPRGRWRLAREVVWVSHWHRARTASPRRSDARRLLYDIAFYMPSVAPLFRPQPGPAPGGAETQVWMLCRQLARDGTRVALVVEDDAELPDSVDGVILIRRPSYVAGGSLIDKAKEISRVLRIVWRLPARTIVKRGYSYDAALVGLAARAHRRTFVYSSASVLDFAPRTTVDRRLVSMLRLAALRLASIVVVQTEEQMEMCGQVLVRPPILIRSLADIPSPACSQSREPEFFLWIGRVVAYKRPLDFLELARRLPNVEFRMIVMPEISRWAHLMEQVEELAGDLANVTLMTARPRQEVAQLIGRSWAVVNTSDYEGMPNIFLEGWARGVPAVCLSHDPDGLIVRHGLGLFANNSGDELAAVCNRLLSGSYDRTAASQRCRDYVARYHSPTFVADSWAALLKL